MLLARYPPFKVHLRVVKVLASDTRVDNSRDGVKMWRAEVAPSKWLPKNYTVMCVVLDL